jgi:hypothetical protein
MGVVCADFDGDGWEDVFVANDQQPNLLWINQRNGTFVDRALAAGAALNSEGRPAANMGVACEDVDRDGDFDLYVTHLRAETNVYYRNDGGSFESAGGLLRVSDWSMPDTGFGTSFFDFDNDGRFDLFVANGAVTRSPEPLDPVNPYAERNRLLREKEDGTFVDVTNAAGSALQAVQMSRAAVFGDYDSDGRVDVLVTNNRGPVQLLHNQGSGFGVPAAADRRQGSGQNHWIRIRTIGREDNRDGIGALVWAEGAGQRVLRQVRPQYSYLASNEPTVHFGLGSHAEPVTITIRWPNGSIESWNDLPLDRVHRLAQGTGTPAAQSTAASGAPAAPIP